MRGGDQLPVALQPGGRILTVTIGANSQFNRFMPPRELPVVDAALQERGYKVEHLFNPGDEELLEKAGAADGVFMNLLMLPYMVMGSIQNLVGHLATDRKSVV